MYFIEINKIGLMFNKLSYGCIFHRLIIDLNAYVINKY